MPGKSWAKPKAEVQKVAKAPWEMMPRVGYLVLGLMKGGKQGEGRGSTAGRERFTVGVVSEDVFAGWGKDLGSVEASWKVGSEKGPDSKGSKIFRAAGEVTVMRCGRE